MLAWILSAALAASPALVEPEFPAAYAATKGFTRGRPTSVKLSPDGKTVFFLESGPRSSQLALEAYDVATGKSAELVAPAELLGGKAEVVSVEEQARRERMRQTEKGFTEYALSRDGNRVLLPLSGKLYVLDRSSRAILKAYVGDDPALDPQFSPDGTRVAYVRSNDLFVADVATGKETRLTTGGSDDLTHGLAEFIAQEELDRGHGFWWSPDGSQLAYEEADSRDVEHFTISDPSKPETPGNHFAYPRAGHVNTKIRVGVIPAKGGATRWLEWDHAAWPYLSEVLWQKGAPAPVLEVRSRDQRDLAFLGAADQKPYFREHDDAWIELPDCPRGIESCGAEMLDDGRIVRVARTDSGNAVQVVARDGGAKLLAPARTLLHADATAAYALASDDPTEEPLWKIPLDGSAPTRLTPGLGEHAPFISDAPIFADAFSDAEHPSQAVLRGLDGAERGQLPSQAEAPPLTPKAEFTTVSAGGQTFHAVIVRPHDFNPKKRYPVIDSVYGGPTANVVVRSNAQLLLDQWYADQGFIVVRIDNRGTPRRDRTWEKAILGDFATVPLQDQVDALQALGKKYRELDTTRIGVSGWSFGGYLSALAVLARPDVFKAAVAGAPVVDWADYDTAYTERYLRTPQENPAGYTRSSLLTYAKTLTRPLLLVHGTADDNVYFFHSLKLMDALFANEQKVDFLPMVGQTHILSSPEYRERLYRRTASYFQEHLGGPR